MGKNCATGENFDLKLTFSTITDETKNRNIPNSKYNAGFNENENLFGKTFSLIADQIGIDTCNELTKDAPRQNIIDQRLDQLTIFDQKN